MRDTPRARGLITAETASPVDRALGPYATLRRNGPFALLVTAHAFSAFVDWLYVMALFILAYNLTHSATVVALLTFTRLLPYALLLPVSGLITDRFNPRVIMASANLGRALAVLGLTLVGSTATLPLAFLLVFAATALSSLFRPALLASIPSVVPERRLIEANSVLGQLDMAAFGGGPAIAGFILLIGTSQDALIVAASGLVVSAAAAAAAQVQRHPGSKSESSGLVPLLEGLRFLFGRGERVLLGIALAWAGLTFFGGAYWTLSVVLAVQAFHVDEAQIGFINASYAVGGLLGGFTVAAAITRLRPAATFIIGAGASSVAEILFGLSPVSLLLPLVLFGLVGIADSIAKITATTAIQAAAPRHLLGRVFGGFESLFILAMAAGALVVGPLIIQFGPRVACASIAAAGLGLLLLSLPFLAQLERVLGVRVFLYRVPVLNLLPFQLMEEVVTRLHLERYGPGEIIVRQGDMGDRLYVIKTGRVEVLEERDGLVVRLAILTHADYFGEIALLDEVPRTATCRTLDAVEVYTIQRSDFQTLLTRSETFSEAIRAESIARAGVFPEILRLHA